MTSLSATPWHNWAGNQTSRPRRAVTPRSPEEVSALIRRAASEGLRVKAVGAGHASAAVAVTDGVLVRPDGLTEVRAVDAAAGTVTVGAGLRLDRLGELLAQHGLALPAMGDAPGQTVAGATATGTHGTGRATGALSGLIREMEMVLADGEIVTCAPHENAELFAGARVGLGALGIVTAVTLAVEPAFLLEAREGPLRFAEVLDRFDELRATNDHFAFHWFPHTDRCTVKRANRSTGPAQPLSRGRFRKDDELVANTVFGLACRLGKAAPRTIPKLARLADRARRERTNTDASHKVLTGPHRVRFVDMEYALPCEALVAALREIRELIDHGQEYVSLPVTVRVAPPDDIWLSTAYGRDTAYIAVHMFHGTPYERYFGAVEKVMTAYQGRPHWGKLHTRDAAYLADAYRVSRRSPCCATASIPNAGSTTPICAAFWVNSRRASDTVQALLKHVLCTRSADIRRRCECPLPSGPNTAEAAPPGDLVRNLTGRRTEAGLFRPVADAPLRRGAPQPRPRMEYCSARFRKDRDGQRGEATDRTWSERLIPREPPLERPTPYRHKW